MEATALTKLAAPFVLALMMIGMGLSLVPEDFKRVFTQPKAVLVGTLGQLCLLPIVAFMLLSLLEVDPQIAVGFMILACCPGGPGSNLVVLLCRGDAALSVTLTAVSSLMASMTIPFVAHYSMTHFLDHATPLEMSKILDMGVKVCIITLVPVMLGMIIRSKAPSFAKRCERPVKIGSVAFLIILVALIAVKEQDNLLTLLQQAGLIGLVLCLCTMALGYALARAFRLSEARSRSVMIEVGIQNAALALLITTVMLNNTTMAVPAAVYSPIMLTMAGLLIAFYSYFARNESH